MSSCTKYQSDPGSGGSSANGSVGVRAGDSLIGATIVAPLRWVRARRSAWRARYSSGSGRRSSSLSLIDCRAGAESGPVPRKSPSLHFHSGIHFYLAQRTSQYIIVQPRIPHTILLYSYIQGDNGIVLRRVRGY